MGTSSSYDAPTSGGWPAAKRAATSFGRQGGTGRGNVSPRDVTHAYVAALGGAAAAAAGAVAAREAARHLGNFLGRVADRGLPEAMGEIGLGELVGHDATEVLAALADRLAGQNRTLDEAAVSDAMIAVLGGELLDDLPFEEFNARLSGEVRGDGVVRLLERFLIEYIYIKMLQELGKRLEGGALTSADAYQAEQDIRAFIEASVALEMSRVDPLKLDWDGTEANTVIQGLLADAYVQLE